MRIAYKNPFSFSKSKFSTSRDWPPALEIEDPVHIIAGVATLSVANP